MTWEAFLGGLMPSLLVLIAALAAWLKADAAAKASKDTQAKLEENTALTAKAQRSAAQAVDAARAAAPVLDKIDRQTNGGLEARLDSLEKSIDSTRHELRGHLQTVVNHLQMLTLAVPKPAPPPPPEAPHP